MWYMLCMCTSSSDCFGWKLQFFYVWVKSSAWTGYVYVAVAVGGIQGKSRFIVAGGESRNCRVAEDRMWYPISRVLQC